MTPPFIVVSNQCWEIIKNWVRNVLVFKLMLTLNTLAIIRSIFGIENWGSTLIFIKLKIRHHENLAGFFC